MYAALPAGEIRLYRWISVLSLTEDVIFGSKRSVAVVVNGNIEKRTHALITIS
jgi:hypothetical protein